MNKSIIITADDFGVVPSINRGITDAVLAGKVNSVAVLTNYGDNGSVSIQRTKELISQAAFKGVSLDIGVHLTISSGQPLLPETKNPIFGLCDANGNFKSFKELNKDRIAGNGGLDQLRNELLEQINILKRNDITPKHLSCHHNTLLCFENLFQVYVEVAKETNLPMRSVVVEPALRRNLYTNIFLSAQLSDDNPRRYLREMKKLMKEIGDRFKLHSEGRVLTPEYVDAGFYGPMPLIRIRGNAVSSYCSDRKKRLKNILARFGTSNNQTMEFMVHLRRGKVSFWEENYETEVRETAYSGIDHNYFDSRTVEFLTLMESDLTFLMSEQMSSYGSWDQFIQVRQS